MDKIIKQTIIWVLVNRLNNISDKDFTEIISKCKNWKSIAKSLGYSSGSAHKIHAAILERCNHLGIKPNIDYSSPILKVTKGELFSNRKNWQSARTAIRKLADMIFKKSNKPQQCVICGYDKHIEIAHIKAVSEFSDDAFISEINDINNLVALCPNHHWEFDNGLFSEEDKNKLYSGMEE